MSAKSCRLILVSKASCTDGSITVTESTSLSYMEYNFVIKIVSPLYMLLPLLLCYCLHAFGMIQVMKKISNEIKRM